MSNISETIKNARNQGANRPFGPHVNKYTHTDLESIEVCADPFPLRKSSRVGKYDAIIKALPYGHCIKCEPKDVPTIATSMRKLILAKEIKGRVRSMTDYGDGKGRVWLFEAKD